MKNKVLLEVWLPAAGEGIELRVPRQIQIGKARDMIVTYLHGKNSDFLPEKDALLCAPAGGEIYDLNAFVEETGLTDGSKVLLL